MMKFGNKLEINRFFSLQLTGDDSILVDKYLILFGEFIDLFEQFKIMFSVNKHSSILL